MLVGIEMPWKNIAKIAAALAEATAKGFYRAVRQELNASKEAAAREAAAGQAASTSRSRASEQQRAMETNARLGITLRESMQILDVKEPLKAEEIKQRYEHLFAVNDKSKGGTIYLQAKIYRAKERLDNELERIEKEKEDNATESVEEDKMEQK